MPKGRTLRQVEEQRTSNEQERQGLFKQLKQQEHVALQERDLKESRRIVEEHKERTFKPNIDALHQPQQVDYMPRHSAPTQAELEHEERRRAFSRLGLITRTPVPNREHQQVAESDAARERRAMFGIPAKPKSFGRPPWA